MSLDVKNELQYKSLQKKMREVVMFEDFNKYMNAITKNKDLFSDELCPWDILDLFLEEILNLVGKDDSHVIKDITSRAIIFTEYSDVPTHGDDSIFGNSQKACDFAEKVDGFVKDSFLSDNFVSGLDILRFIFASLK